MKIENFFSKFRRRIKFNYSKQSVFFDVSQLLFSSANIDGGTFQLIDSLRKNDKIDYKSILDIGCGYGPIGIFLKKVHPDSKVNCIDRDSLALEFTKQNAKLNNCEIDVYPSLDYQNVKEKFSLICCNYPAKVGINALKRFVYDASRHLKQNGIFVIVIKKDLLKDFESILRDEIEILHKQKSSSHFVFHIKYKKEIVFSEESYARNKVIYKLDNKSYELKTAYNLPEFESPSFTTSAIIKILKETQKGLNIFMINPFQGNLGIAAFHYAKPNTLNLVSRDLLSLKYSKENLKNNGFDKINLIHKIIVDKEKGDLLIWRINEDLELAQLKNIFEEIKYNFNRIILGSSRSKLKKIIKLLNLKPISEKEENGSMSILIKPTKGN
jgi:16S rRNA (guanine1207-N2)-methyltransferase